LECLEQYCEQKDPHDEVYRKWDQLSNCLSDHLNNKSIVLENTNEVQNFGEASDSNDQDQNGDVERFDIHNRGNVSAGLSA
jgi:hypothetical protein